MNNKNLQHSPAGIPVDEITEVVLLTLGFQEDSEGRFRASEDTYTEWRLVRPFDGINPTIQCYRLESGGTVYWQSGVNGVALFEYKRSSPSSFLNTRRS